MIRQNPYLEWFDEQRQVQHIEILDRLSIGRTCKGIAANKRIILQGLSLSRDHAVIKKTATFLQITDNSKNGTWVNGIRMTAGSSRKLSLGDIILIGEVSFRLLCPENIFVDQGLAQPTQSTVTPHPN